MTRRTILIGLVALVLAVGLGFAVWLQRPHPIFPNISGPSAATPIEAVAPVELSSFDVGGDHRLAILVTDPKAGWLALLRGFRAHGVPVTVTRDADKALRHKVVLVYPTISGRVLKGPQISALAQHVRDGGTVVAFDLAGGGLEQVFGVVRGEERNTRTRLAWTDAAGPPRAREIAVSSTGEARVGTIGYRATTARALATFEDGSVGAACRSYRGHACVLGVDLGSLAQRAMNGRAESISRTYVNDYDPSLDVLFRWLRDIYVAGEPQPWLISTAPSGAEVSILFTHDIDARTSPHNAIAYAEALKARGLAGTFFVQTKYVKDYNDVAFFDPATVPDVRRLVGMGMDVGSHTVAHSRVFDEMPLGDGEERYPAYRPFVKSDTVVRGGSILGELRVSKFLLEELAGARVQAFRPGRLSYPFTLPQALNATGYSYSSSITANTVLTHLPFEMSFGRRANAALQPVWEFPVTIEDEEQPMLGDRIDAADKLIGQIARDRGVVVILIHPNITGHKLAFEEAIADRWAGRAWMGSISDFGAWWAARDALWTDVVEEDGRYVLKVRADQPTGAVSITLPKIGREVRINLKANATASIPMP